MRILCAIALLCVGLAHKPPVLAGSQPTPAELSEYVLPDGTIAVLCLPDHGEDGKIHPAGLGAGSGCEACRLSASTILPSPPATAGEPMATTLATLEPPRFETPYRQLFPPNAAPRAPPLSVYTA